MPVPLLLEFMIIITPGSTVLVLLGWLVKTKYESSVTQLRVNVTRSEAHLEAAGRRAVVAEGTAREALTGMNELVDEKVTELTQYLVDQIEGTAGGGPGGRHARPGLPGQELPAIGAGQGHEQEHKEMS
jgi:hypothetical protein